MQAYPELLLGTGINRNGAIIMWKLCNASEKGVMLRLVTEWEFFKGNHPMNIN